MVDTDDTRRTMDDGRRTTPWVWHKLPTGELKIITHRLTMAQFMITNKILTILIILEHIFNQEQGLSRTNSAQIRPLTA